MIRMATQATPDGHSPRAGMAISAAMIGPRATKAAGNLTQRRVDRCLETGDRRERFDVGKWKQLHQNYTGDAPCRVDPEVGVAEAGPGDASCARAAQPDVLRFYLGDHGMPKQVVLIAGTATPPSPFNHVVRAGDFLFVSSQLSVDLATHTLLPGDTASQTRQAI
jgi:hypothetical protein